MKNETEYRKELFNAMQNGNNERAKDIKDILSGKAFEAHNFFDLLANAESGKRLIQTEYSKEFSEQFCK